LQGFIFALLVSEIQSANIRRKMKNKRKTTTAAPPLLLFNALSKDLANLFNPVQWFQQAEQQRQQMSTESPDNVITEESLIFNINDPKTGQSAEYTTGNAKVDRTITSFFGAMTQIFDNMFKTFVTPAMNGTIWDETPRANGSGGLANFLSSFFCQIFMGLLSPNYKGKRCFVYRYPSTTPTPRTPVQQTNAPTRTPTPTTEDYNYY